LAGSIRREPGRKLDLLTVGNPDQTRLAAEVRTVEKTLRREINSTVLTQKELNRRLRKRDPFVTDIWNGDRINL
jgi:hypothetical protein